MRERSPDDARAWALQLTDSGQSLLRAARRPFATVNATIGRALDDRQVRDLGELLNLVIDSFR